MSERSAECRQPGCPRCAAVNRCPRTGRSASVCADDTHVTCPDLTAQPLVDMETGTCGRCGRAIVWEFDNDEDSYGMWFTVEHGTDACIPGPNDEDRYHSPR